MLRTLGSQPPKKRRCASAALAVTQSTATIATTVARRYPAARRKPMNRTSAEDSTADEWTRGLVGRMGLVGAGRKRSFPPALLRYRPTRPPARPCSPCGYNRQHDGTAGPRRTGRRRTDLPRQVAAQGEARRGLADDGRDRLRGAGRVVRPEPAVRHGENGRRVLRAVGAGRTVPASAHRGGVRRRGRRGRGDRK